MQDIARLLLLFTAFAFCEAFHGLQRKGMQQHILGVQQHPLGVQQHPLGVQQRPISLQRTHLSMSQRDSSGNTAKEMLQSASSIAGRSADEVKRSINERDSANLTTLFKSLVEDDKIFFLHSVSALFGGFMLFFFPAIFALGNHLAEAGNQRLAIFWITVSFLSFLAPTQDGKTKSMLSSAFTFLCAFQALSYGTSIFSSVFRSWYSPWLFILDSTGLVVFAFLTAGYLVNGKSKTTD